MANQCLGELQACATRVTRLDSDGSPLVGEDNLYVTDSLISLEVSADIKEGDDFESVNACGTPCVSFKDDDVLRRVDLSMEICKPDPELLELLVGGTVLESGEATGYGFPSLNQVANPDGVSLELFVRHVTEGGDQDPTFPWVWWVIPKAKLFWNGITFENAIMNPTFNGFAIENASWGDGPLNDWPVASTQVIQKLPTDSIPDTACGYQSVPS